MQKQPTSRTCFMCGRENDLGLKMEWYNDPDAQEVKGEIEVPEQFNGYPGIVHGGIVAAILDETAGRALMIDGNFENLFVTLKLNVTYRQVTPTQTTLTAVGWIVKKGNRSMRVAAELRLADGTVTAECEAVVVLPPKQISKLWEPEREHWRVEEDD
ncbi:MAG: PaaI family thioesterase [candidate division KSB1 bacterium]|nr:PaaI family thioesterase [candidate division KSB1 bacterium]